MATAVRGPCTYSEKGRGCPLLAEPGTGRCAEHKRPAWEGAGRGRRGRSGWDWQRTCEQIKARDGGRCVECGSTQGLTVHHRIAVARGGTDQPSNLVTLCGGRGGCHEKHMSEARTSRQVR